MGPAGLVERAGSVIPDARLNSNIEVAVGEIICAFPPETDIEVHRDRVRPAGLRKRARALVSDVSRGANAEVTVGEFVAALRAGFSAEIQVRRDRVRSAGLRERARAFVSCEDVRRHAQAALLHQHRPAVASVLAKIELVT